MNTVLITVSAVLILLTAVAIKVAHSKSEEMRTKDAKIAELSKEKDLYFLEMEKNKEVYSSDRKAMIAENESLKVKLEDSSRKLANFSEEQSNYYSEMDNLNNFSREMTPEEFLSIREKVMKSGTIHDFTGIYILYNKTHDKFYVGQSVSVLKRAGNHLTGKGNQDIYEDYMRGDVWTVKTIALSNSGFKSINALEKHFIEHFHSTYNGYNKTIGNKI